MRKILSVFLMLIFLISGSGCIPTTQVVEIEKAILAAEIDDELVKFDDSEDGFAETADKIIFAGVLKNGKNILDVKWIKKSSEKALKSESKTTDNEGKFNFEIFKPTTGWDGGEYTLEVYSGDTKLVDKDFEIISDSKKTKLYNKSDEKNNPDKKARGAKSDISGNVEYEKTKNENKSSFVTPKSNPAQIANNQKGITTPDKAKNSVFINGVMCDGLNDDGSCLGKTQFYYDDANVFNANTEWKNLSSGDSLWGVWYWEGFNGQGEYLADAVVSIKSDQSGYVNFSLTGDADSYWYNGSYWIEIYQNDEYFTTIPFGVYQSNFKPSYKFPSAGYYDWEGDYILYDGTGYYDIYGNFWDYGTDWGMYDWYDYPESGWYDEFGDYILDDGTGYYDSDGYFWFWEEMYGDGWYDEYGNYYLADGSGYFDTYGDYWPTDWYTPADDIDGYFDDFGNYILNDGSGWYDVYGDYWSWYDDYYDDYYYDYDGYYDSFGNYVLYDDSGYYDIYGDFYYWDDYIYDDYDYVDEDGYYDSYGNYILYDGSGYYDSYGDFYYYDDDYYYDDYYYDDDYYGDHPNGDVEYWDDYSYDDDYYEDYYYDDYYYDDYWY